MGCQYIIMIIITEDLHLEAGCVVCEPLDPVQSDLDLLLADGVVTSGVVVTGVLLKVHTTFMNWLLMLVK